MAIIGAHVSIAGGLEKGIERGEALGCEAIQIFTKNQLQWRSAPLSQSRGERFYRAWAESSIQKVVVHASYLINLAAVDATGPKSMTALEDEIERCELLGIDDLVLHPGSSRGRDPESALELVAERLGQIIRRTEHKRVRILLETMAGQGDLLGRDLKQFAFIMERIDWTPRVGICMDTCHLFAAGYELRTKAAYQRLVDQVDSLLGLDRVGCWHLNDSFHDLGRGLDRHAHIGEGELGYDPFAFILNDSLWVNTPCILETPIESDGHARNLAILRKLRGG
ncbi:MAG: deoxyribonuclease IV [Synergistaceae bacterium]|nr:deoxyribonuclease IV [Synergistota bacterium]NLM70813.1 deoxyribonuclease IV [Synergistaceae bacterium]